MPGVGPALGEGAVEAFDLAVGLRPVGAGAFGVDAELGAGVAPGEGPVGRAVVGEDTFDGDAAGGEPAEARRRTAMAVAAVSSSWISA